MRHLRQLVGASIPRSGHHFLVHLLRGALADRLHYCERYGVDRCCAAIPCQKPAADQLAFLKCHDFDDELDSTRRDVRFVVQYRNAVEAVLSDRELFVARNGSRFTDVPGQYDYWLGLRAHYMIRFAGKWLRRPRDHHFLLDYRDLIAEPAKCVRDLLAFCDVACDEASIREAALARMPLRDNPVDGTQGWSVGAYVPRKVETSRFFDGPLLSQFEAIIADAAPELAEVRYFPTARAKNSLVAFALQCRLAADQRPASTHLQSLRQRLEELAEYGHAHFAFARVLRAAGDLDGAASALTTALELGVADPDALIDAVELSRARGDRSMACVYAERILEAQPDVASHELFMGNLLLEAGRIGDAVVHAARALELGMSQPHLWSACSNILEVGRSNGYRIQVDVRSPAPEAAVG